MKLAKTTRYICRSCRLQARRGFSSSATRRGQGLPDNGFAQLQSRRLLAVYGHDAGSFLQGLTTANIPTSGLLSSPSNPQALYSAFMNAQGRLLHDVFIYPLHPQQTLRDMVTGGTEGGSTPAFLIEVDSTQVSRLQAVLKKYKLRAKVNIRTVEEGELGVYAAWNSGQGTASPGVELSESTASNHLVTLDPRVPGPWHRVLTTKEEADLVREALRLRSSSELEYTLQRYLQGVPEGQQELPREETLLHEANIDLMHGVDFRKGCYVGQELVIRTQHTGVVRKRVMPVQIWTDEAPPDGSESQAAPVFEGQDVPDSATASDASTSMPSPLSFLLGQNIRTKGAKRPDGKLLGTVGNLGLAMCRLERVTEADDSGARGKTKTLELDLSSVDGAPLEKAWLRPFVPPWWEERGKIMEGGYESLKVRAPGPRQKS